MKAKQIAKRIFDLLMLVLLPILMAEILTGQKIHEWLGVAMIVCFILHHILNFSWIKNLFKGDYTPARCFMTVVNLLLFADMLVLAVSGIMMSGFVFSWLNVSGGMLLARRLHLFASYWGLILMSAHAGLHIGMMHKAFRKLFHMEKDSVGRTWILRILTVGMACYGMYAFVSQKIMNYLFLQTHFVLFDETKQTIVFFLETVALIVLFAAVSYYLQKLLGKVKADKAGKQAAKIIAFVFPLFVCVAVIAGLNMGAGKTPSWEQSVPETPSAGDSTSSTESNTTVENPPVQTDVKDGFILIKGGSFQMGSPADEAWRVEDEEQHTVSVSDFYISPYEVTQKEYADIMGSNPSSFSGDNLPVENITWLEAIAYCNACSEKAGLMPVYILEGETVTWNRTANGYRLPTEAEWEYACRAGTTTPFNTENFEQYDIILIGYAGGIIELN